jgi:hypothetical protein
MRAVSNLNARLKEPWARFPTLIRHRTVLPSADTFFG